MPDDSKSLVLGTAFRLSREDVWVFVESLRRHYRGPAILLVTSYDSDELVAYLRSRDVTPVYFDGPYWMVAHVQLMRYVRYGELLRGCGTAYERILLCDVSDVVFQGHPFAAAPAGELLCFMEDPGWTIGKSKNTSLWVEQIFGREVLARLADRPISCSGTTIGSHRAILRYVDLLLSHADVRVLVNLSQYRGHDQGIHNYLLHTGALPEARLVPNAEHVYTLGLVSPQTVELGPAGTLLSPEHRCCPIVHQYTYRPRLKAHVLAEYPLGR
jgi:hypothetical protein